MNKRFHFIGILALLLMTGFMTTSLVSYQAARNSLSRQIEESTLPLTSDNIYSEIQRDLLRPIFISSLMAHDTFVRDWVVAGEVDAGAMVRYLTEIQQRYGAVTSFFVSEKTHRYYHPSGVLKQVAETDAQDRWYFHLQQIADDYEINVDTDTADRQSMVIFINYRVYDYAGRFIGATGVGLAVAAVSKLIGAYQDRYGRRVLFVDTSGRVMLHSPNYDGVDDIHNAPGLSALAPAILSTPDLARSYSANGRTVYLNSRWVKEFDWYLVVEQVEDAAEKRIRRTLIMNLCISLVISLVVLLLANLTLGRYQRRIEKLAATDELTGLANRHTLGILFEQAVRNATRKNAPLCMILFDLDRFKRINDAHGHTAGDLVLKATATAAKALLRESDSLCRWGGEEFLALLPDCELEHAVGVAEKIRRGIEDDVRVAIGGQTLSLTASFGVSQWLDGDSLAVMLKRIDDALYTAKARGRNTVVAGTAG